MTNKYTIARTVFGVIAIVVLVVTHYYANGDPTILYIALALIAGALGIEWKLPAELE